MAASGSFSRERSSEDPPWNNRGYNNKVLACGSSFISNGQNWLSDLFFLCSWLFSVVKSAFFLVLSLHMNGLYLELASMLQSLLHPDTQR